MMTSFAASESQYVLPFERQSLALCGMHALNNVLAGEPIQAFTQSDMHDACETVLFESNIPDDNGQLSDSQIREDHESPTGWYSLPVMTQALRGTFKYELSPALQLRHNAGDLFAPTTVGAVMNIDNQHWVALKSVEGQIWYLDSQSDPWPLTYDEYLVKINAHEHTYSVRLL